MNKYCKICNKLLLSTDVDYIDYFCQTRIAFPNKASIPHYNCFANQEIVWYAPPYKIKVFENASSIFQFVDDNLIIDNLPSPINKYLQPEFKFIFKVKYQLHPDDPGKVAERIKKLILFS